MTDAEIIKALETHLSDEGECGECAYSKNIGSCVGIMHKDLYDLINRQKAEIEYLRKAILDADYSSITALKAKQNWYIENSEYIRKLNEENDKLTDMYYSMQSTLAKMSMGVEQAKAEAIKEINARIYAYKTGIYINGEELIIIPMSDYNEILKEMEGDAE